MDRLNLTLADARDLRLMRKGVVDGRGGLSELEMSSIANDAVEVLQEGEKPITVKRLMVGSFMVSTSSSSGTSDDHED